MQNISTRLKRILTTLILIGTSSLGSVHAEPAYEPIFNYHPTSIFAQIGHPVGRLRIQTSRGRSGCTAFLISETHLMTNEHCVGKRAWDHKKREWFPRIVLKVKVEMAAVDPKDNSSMETFAVQMPPLEINEALDYAIMKVEGNPAAKYGYLAISTAKPQMKMPLWIIGHPKLKVQQISRVRCMVIKHPIPHPNRLHHTCPTAGGNSGSPVFDASTSEVIALNYAHYSVKVRDIGLAVSFHEIAKQSPLLREILKTQ